jgi:cytidine deaminase
MTISDFWHISSFEVQHLPYMPAIEYIPLADEDKHLIELAMEAIRKGYRENWHSIGAALRTSDGSVFTSIHFDATVGRISICAEPIAMANAIMSGKNRLDTIVAVKHPNVNRGRPDFEVVSPCGMCREMITDYDPETKVIIKTVEGLKKLYMRDLLPYKYKEPYP